MKIKTPKATREDIDLKKQKNVVLKKDQILIIDVSWLA